jgi:glycosyltransferase involved in cell wall biosynthesis
MEKYLAQCLDSILGQTLHNIEVICVNDGSSDNSLSILEQYQKKDARVRVISQKNGGLSHARNVGLDAAQGEYISFVDSDDYIDETMLEKLYGRAKKTDSDITICNLILDFADRSKEEQEIFRDVVFYTFLKNKIFKASDYPQIIECIGAWDRIYKRELIEINHLRFPEGLMYEDHLFTVQADVFAKKMTVVSEALYYYRKNTGESITDREAKNDNFKYDYLEISRRAKEFFKEQGVYQQFQREYLMYQFFYAHMHQQNATSYKCFKRFFNEMREMTSESDYHALENCEQLMLKMYAKMLKNNQLNSCYVLLKMKKNVYRDEQYIYLRIPFTKKDLKIWKRKRRRIEEKCLSG